MKNKCSKCKYEWMARVENPLQCPKCKRYDWKNQVKEETKIKKGAQNVF